MPCRAMNARTRLCSMSSADGRHTMGASNTPASLMEAIVVRESTCNKLLVMTQYDPAVILSACRTAIGSFGGALKDLAAADLGAVVIREAIARAGVQASDVGDVIMGCVLQAGAGM